MIFIFALFTAVWCPCYCESPNWCNSQIVSFGTLRFYEYIFVAVDLNMNTDSKEFFSIDNTFWRDVFPSSDSVSWICDPRTLSKVCNVHRFAHCFRPVSLTRCVHIRLEWFHCSLNVISGVCWIIVFQQFFFTKQQLANSIEHSP
jgi:hypothetical protein